MEFITFLGLALGFALATSATPGTVTMMATVNGHKFGVRDTVPFSLGATLTFTALLYSLGYGVSEFGRMASVVESSVTVLGSAYLLYLVYKLASSSLSVERADRIHQGLTFRDGIALQALNPKAWAVALSGVSLFASSGDSQISAVLVLCLIYFPVCFFCILAYARLGGFVSRIKALPTILGAVIVSIVIMNLLRVFFL